MRDLGGRKKEGEKRGRIRYGRRQARSPEG